jgi:Tfp pilus assembly PilM family ATPase
VDSDGLAKQELICFAASRELIMRQVQTARSAGLDVVGMHGEPLAIIEAFAHLFRRSGDEQRTTFFIDIGASTTKALIAHGKQIVFAKTIHVGGDHFTRQFAERHGLDFSDARARRVQEMASEEAGRSGRLGEPAEPSYERNGAAAVKTLDPVGASQEAGEAEAASRLEQVAEENGPGPAADASSAGAGEPDGDEMLEALIDELQLCVGYHGSMFQDRPIEKAVFLGGEASQTETCQRIARALQLPAQRADPLSRLVRPRGASTPLGADLRQAQPGWAVPLGLCLLPTNL